MAASTPSTLSKHDLRAVILAIARSFLILMIATTPTFSRDVALESFASNARSSHDPPWDGDQNTGQAPMKEPTDARSAIGALTFATDATADKP